MADREILAELVKKAQAGDKASLEKLFSLSYNDIYYFALKTTKNEDLAYDITQEVCIDIFKNISTLQDPATFVAWSKRITYNRCAMHFRKNHEVIVDDSDEDGNIFDTIEDSDKDFIPAEALDQEDFRKTIMGIVNKLPQEQQAAVLLYYFDELSVSEIAKIQGVSEGTVKSRLNYARKAIKAAVEDYEDKNNVKLHSFGMLPFMFWLFRGEKLSTSISAVAKEMAQGAVGLSSTATVTASTAASASSSTVAATAASAVGKGIAGKIVAVTLAASVALGGGGLAYKVIKDKQENKNSAFSTDETASYEDDENIISEETEKIENEDVSSVPDEEFSSDDLTLFKGFEDKRDQIHHFFSAPGMHLVTKSGEIYSVADTSTPVYTQVDPERVYMFFDSLTYVDKNNTLYSDFLSTSTGYVNVTGEVVGISTAGLLNTYTYIFTRESDGILYLSTYDRSNGQDGYIDKYPLYASCDGVELGRVTDIEISYSPTYGWASYEIKTANALYYCSEGAMNITEDNRAVMVCSQVITDITFISAQAEYDNDTPFFYKNSDESKILYLNESIFGYSETSFNVPTEYTASQAERVIKVNGGQILVEFNDGAVYSVNEVSATKLEALSQLNSQGKVNDIFVVNQPYENASFTIFLSLTDDRLYYYLGEY